MNRKGKIRKQKWLGFLLLMATLLAGNQVAAAEATPAVNSASQPVQTAAVQTTAGTGATGDANGSALSAIFRKPGGITQLPDGTLAVADTENHLIRKLAAGFVSTYAGITVTRDEKGYPGGMLLDGSRDRSLFQRPQGIAADAHGNLYVADSGNHAIRKITTTGVETIAGTGVPRHRDGSGSDAQFYAPSALAIAKDGTIYVTDTLNHAIRKIAPNGKVSTLNKLSDRKAVLTEGYTEFAGDFRDGKLSEAKFNEPSGIAIDAKGNLFVSDTGNQRIRYINLATETVSTVAGSPALSYQPNSLYADGGYKDGAASIAQFHFPKGIAVTEDGGLVIADSMNHVIRYLHGDSVSTIAGTSDRHEASHLRLPVDVAVDASGTVWIVDSFANQIRQFTVATGSSFIQK
ncbi:copper amine oxidase [Brevibacillus ruminantium]|uniref:Copper amine oxidase n=1 Tax=Brevibacillus ruminantium TaxID=2950604 RepID=A0ABY4W8W4_9BACL|nr:copper amine oxidase [Brevibacillus ruminantium]USG63286.1 copper amine oxidase [Brevibacillus ruminantium]